MYIYAHTHTHTQVQCHTHTHIYIHNYNSYMLYITETRFKDFLRPMIIIILYWPGILEFHPAPPSPLSKTARFRYYWRISGYAMYFADWRGFFMISDIFFGKSEVFPRLVSFLRISEVFFVIFFSELFQISNFFRIIEVFRISEYFPDMRGIFQRLSSSSSPLSKKPPISHAYPFFVSYSRCNTFFTD